MEINKRKDEAFEVLNQVKKDSQTISILTLLHLRVRPNLRSLQAHFLVTYSYYQLLLPDFIRLWPLSIFAIENSAFKDNPPHLIDDSLRNKSFVGFPLPCFLMS